MARLTAAWPMRSGGRHSGRSWRVGGAQNCKSRVTRCNPLDTPLWPHCSGEHLAVARPATPGGSYGRWTVSRWALSGETARTVASSFVTRKRTCFDDSRSSPARSPDSAPANPRQPGCVDPRSDEPPREAQDPDLLVPPRTDHGTLPNLRWSFADSHNHLSEGGWARQTTIRELPSATEIAAVNMRRTPPAPQQLPYHNEAPCACRLDGPA